MPTNTPSGVITKLINAVRDRDVDAVVELFAVYRRAVLEMCEAVKHPTAAHRDRSLQRAVAHIQRHFTEPLRRATLARLAGFAPNYFSELFKKREGMSCESYLRNLRLDGQSHQQVALLPERQGLALRHPEHQRRCPMPAPLPSGRAR